MLRRIGFVLLVLGAAVGCSGTGSGNPVGPAECETDDDCVLSASTFVESAAPAASSPYQILGARCDLVGFAGTPAEPGCICDLGGGSSLILVAGPSSQCLVHSRDRTCLYAADEAAGCDPDDASSCDDACADLQARLDLDAQRTLDVEIRSATCNASRRCDFVLRVENGCYVGPSLERHDCALSDEEILAASGR